MEIFKESFCPLFLTYALVMLLLCIKAAFITHGMSRGDLLFALIGIAIPGGYFASFTGLGGLAVNSVFNLVVPALLLRYLGAEKKPLAVITGLFFLGTIVAYYGFKVFR